MTTAEAETKPAAEVNGEAAKKQDANVEATDNGETAKNKRGLHASLGDFASFGGHESYAHADFGHGGGGGDFGGFGGGHGGGDIGGHGDFGGFQGGGGYGGGFEGHGHDYGASEHHHEHVKHITVEKKIPV